MSMAEERRAPQIAVAQPVMEAIGTLPEDQADAVRAAIRTIGVQAGEPIDLPTAPPGYPYQAQRPRLATAPLVIYRQSQQGEPGKWLVVSLMTPEEFRQQKQDEQSEALRNPEVRRFLEVAAGTAATYVNAEMGGVSVAVPQPPGTATSPHGTPTSTLGKGG